MGFARHPWRASHFLCLHKESNQRNAPSRSRSRGHPARVTSRAGSGVCRQYVHVLSANSRASCARPFGLFLRLLAATWRGPGRAKEKRGSCRRSFKNERSDVLLFAVDPSVKQRRSDEEAACTARGARHGWRAFGDRAGALPPNPADRSEPARSAGAQPRVHFFGYFLCASKESDSAARKADETRQGRTLTQREERNAKSLGSRLRGNDEKKNQNGFRLSPE